MNEFSYWDYKISHLHGYLMILLLIHLWMIFLNFKATKIYIDIFHIANSSNLFKSLEPKIFNNNKMLQIFINKISMQFHYIKHKNSQIGSNFRRIKYHL